MTGCPLTLLSVLVTLAVLKEAQASGLRQSKYQRNVGMDGRQLIVAALFQVSSSSITRCIFQCNQLDGCRSCTFIADQPSSCRGYDVIMTSPTATGTEPAAGAKTFEKQCVSDSECPGYKLECFKGLCLCTPGFYYSTGGNTCLNDCPLADLGDTFVRYKESAGYINPNLWYTDNVLDLPRCLAPCLHNFTSCRSLDYKVQWPQCAIYPEVATVSGPYRRDFISHDHYQKTCA